MLSLNKLNLVVLSFSSESDNFLKSIVFGGPESLTLLYLKKESRLNARSLRYNLGYISSSQMLKRVAGKYSLLSIVLFWEN